MQKSILKQAKKIHLVGIGGSGMSGLAMLLFRQGKTVTGSDLEETPLLARLRQQGITVKVGHRPENISPELDLVVCSHAVRPDNPEFQRAVTLRIPVVSYPEALGLLMQEKRGIAIAGTHGKTTSSALVVTILKSGGLSPSFVIGGEICGLGNSEVGSGEYLIVEACEYRRSFLAYYPEIAVITSVEEDHLDYYRDLSEIQEAFGCFAARVRPEGALIVCAEDKRALHCAGAAVARVITYGFNGADWQAGSVTESAGGISFECFFRCEFFGSFSLPLLGRHNVLNALGAIAVGKELGLTAETLSRALASFPGVHRRLEKIAEVGEVIIMDDYGHHPTEIRATLLALRGRYPQRRVIVIFQPHQYSRTRFLLEDFAASFNLADKVIVPDIYFVRDSEREKQLVNAGMLAEKIRGHGRQALYLPTATEIIAYLKEIVKPGDLVITIGAGPINRVGWQFAQELQKKVLASPSLPEDLPAESKLT